MRFRQIALLAAASLAALITSARADTITIAPDTGTPILDGSYYKWSYTASLSEFGYIKASEQTDYFQINNVSGFQGFDGAGSLNATFAGTSSTSWNAVATEINPGVYNLKFTYTSGLTNDLHSDDGVSPLVTITFYDGLGTKKLGTYDSQDHVLDSDTNSVVLEGVITQSTYVPGLANPGDISTPLPAAAWGGMGLLGVLGGLRAIRRQTKAQ